MALAWLVRPILLLFVISVGQSPLAFSVSESEALINLKKSFTNSSALSSWISGSAPCKGHVHWNGLLCSNGIVTGLRLENMGLSGKIDVDALLDISGLRTMSISHNSFTGAIPEFNRLGYLKALYVTGNQFSGEIPSDFFLKMPSLKKVWLSNNKFTGKIPPSLGKLSNLMEVHLEGNQFSGMIPAMEQSTLVYFNVSNNKLEGGIPDSLRRFKAGAFQGNADICGDTVGKMCSSKTETSLTQTAAIGTSANVTSTVNERKNLNKTIAGFITLAVLLASVAAVIIFKLRKKCGDDDDSETANRESNADEPVEVQVSLPSRTKVVELNRKSGSSRRGSNNGKGGIGELVIVNDAKGPFGLPDLMKAAAEVLGNGGLGSSYKAVMANGLAVVVKRMREMNALGRDGFDAEIRKLGGLQHRNILRPLAFHFRKDEKLLIYEYIPKGSLLYLLHGDRGPSHAELNWSARLNIVRGIGRGLGHLHTEMASSELPHGNLKSSNVLIGPDNEPFLSEFGFSPLINPSVVAQALFAYKAPEAAQYGVSPKCDVYCLGVVILEILTGKFPSQYLNNSRGGIDVVQWVTSTISEGKELELLDPEIAGFTASHGEMIRLLHVGVACIESNPVQRLEIGEAIRWIEDIKLEAAAPDDGRIQVSPTFQDGYADAQQTNVPGTGQGHVEHSRRGAGSGSSAGRYGSSDSSQFSFTIS